ncbi:phospholipase B1, membrane-associated [Cryptotermes secundus]|uniref:phospholipase B1, membrane-associated n=1 Tax=Cryptotermes secundus TaxID=105785 RepID=UPI001454DB33|nr:phospholipase B1, membrane-associated [Cryptotermes secundus]
MGDSITAGNGAASLNMMQAYVENRGLSFAIGGESTWRKYLTLPNILKEFNPKLVGYSLGDSLGFMNDSKFNVAEPIAMNRDLVFQSKLLIRRMKADQNVDFYKDWKIVTVLMGHNDFCSDMCYRDWTILPEKTRTELEIALSYLQENMPRALINLVPPLDVTNIKSITNAAPECQMFFRVACSCFFGPRGEYGQEVFKKIIKMSQQIYFEIQAS